MALNLAGQFRITLGDFKTHQCLGLTQTNQIRNWLVESGQRGEPSSYVMRAWTTGVVE